MSLRSDSEKVELNVWWVQVGIFETKGNALYLKVK